MYLRTLGGLLNFRLGGSRTGQQKVITEGIVEEPGALGEAADLLPDLLLGPGVQVAARQGYLTVGIIPETQQQVRQGGFPGSTRPNDGYALARG